MIRFPSSGNWIQANNSDKFGDISASRCINLDSEGYLKLSSRAFSVYSEDTTHPDSDTSIGRILAIGRYSEGDFTAVAEGAPQNLSLSTTSFTNAEDEESGNPTTTDNSWGTFWQNRWYVSGATTVVYKAIASGAGGTWTSAVTGLTTGVTHALEVFRNRNQLCVANANVVKQYDTSHANTIDLTIPADFEIVGMSYSNAKMGIITRLASTIEGQGQDAYFFVWKGDTTSAETGVPIGSDSAVGIAPYLGSWVILTRAGQLLFWNGGGFQVLDAFPLYFRDAVWGDFLNKVGYGINMWTEGDVIYISVNLSTDQSGRNLESYLPYCPSGIWCFDPKAGLYHRYAPSLSTMSLVSVGASGANTTTNIMTAASGTIPATGNIFRYTSASSDPIGGLEEYQDYYVIKLSSSTFQLATSYENALAGIAIDLTSQSAQTSYFAAFDIVDFNAVSVSGMGSLAVVGTQSPIYDHLIFGANVDDYRSSANNNHFMVTVPDIENRGYFKSAKLFAQSTSDTMQEYVIRHHPLKTGDKIIIKEKSRELTGLPVSTVQGNRRVTWVSTTEFYTTANLSAVKTAFDASKDIECEILSGAGAGTMEQVTAITEEDGTYAVTLANAVKGASSTRVSEVQFDNFKVFTTITTDNEKEDCIIRIPIGTHGSWSMFKVELQGTDITIEEARAVSVPHKR